ncbi:hypothetical protein [Methylobacter sp.]|uniref:hypothetical protein n=1 Tax=Methylobacter sp. TaxID=2051955 RepID=UPI0024875A0F|nr:hypothetical protein [Methylobacter sp.]MDI1276143.1 hypothetical protein [Methylobacter sp.]MDI1356968.1 hypothetical protein [Methylobacter sp.]
MIRSATISQYPINILDEKIVNLISKNKEMESTRVYQMISLLNAFLDITNTKISLINLNKAEYKSQIKLGVIGFIYTEIDGTGAHRNALSADISRILRYLCERCDVTIPKNIRTSYNSITDDAYECIEYYNKSFKVNRERILFYAGWIVKNKDENEHAINLVDCYNAYGEEYTTKLHKVLSKISLKERKTTLNMKIYSVISLLKYFIKIFHNLNDLNVAMSSNNVHETIALVYNLQLIDVVNNKLCPSNFHIKWKRRVIIFEQVFVQSNLASKPLVDFFTPDFKSSGNQITSATKIKQDVSGNVFNSKLITPIPLKYTDNKAKEIIFDSIRKDIDHVTYHCEILVDEIMKRYRNYQQLMHLGEVKVKNLPGTTGHGKGGNSVDMTLDRNVCATFANYRWNSPVMLSYYTAFIGFHNNGDLLNKLICMPTSLILVPFILLLINQHPLITTAWLINWKLYDKNGRNHGYKQTKSSWIAVSEKPRKGHEKAEQTIILNDISNLLVQQIIQITSQAREHLREQGNEDYKCMLICSNGINDQPRRLNRLPHLSQSKTCVITQINEPSPFRDAAQIESISKSLSYSSMRASCGIRVYLETGSVHAMAEALGHERYDPKLISHYLPIKLWDYFTDRWVRLFQNAMVYEAMKDSDFLFDAIDINKNELDEFLINHGLGELPDQLKVGKQKAKDIINDDIISNTARLTVMLSTSLLQVLFVIRLQSNSDENSDVFQKWNETANFVLSHISCAFDDKNNDTLNISDEIKDMYLLAKKNPLPLSSLKEHIS